MSEKAVGYTTIGGDLEGALSVIANVPEDRGRGAARAGCTRASASPASPPRWRPGPGPELADEQQAEDELMPFPILDACLHLYASEKMSPDEMARALVSVCPGERPGLPGRLRRARFARLFTQSIYKWVQSPLALHVGSLDLDRERALQMPVVQRTEW